MDFQALGFKAGLECHQQLEAGKLFSRTPPIVREGKADIAVKRKLRASASEMGEFDLAALEEAKKDYTYIYQVFSDANSLVELDEEPPQDIDRQALETVLMIAQMCNAKILDTVFVMRKIVLDGSNTSAFQRTGLVAIGGSIPVGKNNIGIETIVIEEDSARPLEKKAREIVYNLDRLGIALIELATKPDIRNPAELKETAKKIGELLRRTCRAKRGLGRIRQDINVSIKNGTRVEIKGVQDLEMIDAIAEREVQRQIALLEIKKQLEERNAKKTDLEGKIFELTGVFMETECAFLKGKKVFGIMAKNFAGLIGKELQPGKRLGTELAGYVKAKTGLKGCIHSDELPAFGITEKEVRNLKEKIGCSEKDAFVIVSASREEAVKALEIVNERMKQCFDGVPKETRNALEDGCTEYSRPLPGAARMYPETDLPPIVIEEKMLKEIRKKHPLTVQEREKLYAAKGLSEKLVNELKLSNYACFFEELLEKNINPKTAAVLLVEGITELKREGISGIEEQEIEKALLAEKQGRMQREIMLDVFRKMKKENKTMEQAIQEIAGKATDEKTIRKEIIEIIEKNRLLVKEKGINALSALMGEAMKKFSGKAPGRVISSILREELSKRT